MPAVKTRHFCTLMYGTVLAILCRALSQQMSETGQQYSIFAPDQGEKHHHKSCNGSEVAQDHSRTGKLVFTVAKDSKELAEVSQYMEDNVQVCKDAIHVGFYHPDNIIVHFVWNTDDLSLSDKFFESSASKRHQRTIVFQPSQAGFIKVSRFNIYSSRVHSYLLDLEELSTNRDWFGDFPMEVKAWHNR